MISFKDLEEDILEDNLIDQKTDNDIYLEHQFHDVPMSMCSLCTGEKDEVDLSIEELTIDEEEYDPNY